MADIELVIKISQEDYDWIKRTSKGNTCYPCTLRLYDAIKNGTPLPKGHGDLIDRKEVLKNMEFEQEGYCDFDCYKPITDAPTIIEADKKSEGQE